MTAASDKLPDDPAALKALVRQQQESLASQDDALARKDHEISELQAKLAWFEEQIRLARQSRFAASSEKNPLQESLPLFNEAETLGEAAEEAETETQQITYTRRKPKGGRKPLPPHLPREEIRHDLPEQEQICECCGGALHCIGEERSEQLDYIPARVKVLVHVRPKYACRGCEEGIRTAPLPPQPIPRSIATPGLLAFVCTSKFVDHLPLYRLEQIFKRIEVDLPRATLANWMIRVGALLEPLYEALRAQLLAGGIIQADETPVQVLKEPGRSPQSRSYMWVYRAGTGPPLVLYDYQPSRASDNPQRFLAGFGGWLQCDGYAAYESLAKNADGRITLVGCLAHVRRKFVDAQKIHPNAKAKRGSAASKAIGLIGKLYAVETRIRDLPPEQRLQVRQDVSRPQFEALRNWVDKTLPRVAPKSVLGKALAYAQNQLPRVAHYLEDGRLEVDNNLCENAIRPFVQGRKAWLFSDTPAGARSSAVIFSVLESAKASGLEPQGYLRALFTRLPALDATDASAVEALLPWRLAETQPDLLLSKNARQAA